MNRAVSEEKVLSFIESKQWVGLSDLMAVFSLSRDEALKMVEGLLWAKKVRMASGGGFVIVREQEVL